jgi:hypothetical protein
MQRCMQIRFERNVLSTHAEKINQKNDQAVARASGVDRGHVTGRVNAANPSLSARVSFARLRSMLIQINQ